MVWLVIPGIWDYSIIVCVDSYMSLNLNDPDVHHNKTLQLPVVHNRCDTCDISGHQSVTEWILLNSKLVVGSMNYKDHYYTSYSTSFGINH